MTKTINEKLAKKCARCFRQRKKCDHEKMSKCLNCMKYKKGKKACLIQCKKCYKKNKEVKEGPFPQCKNCKEITEDSPGELICEENGKIYFKPGNGKKYEINEEIFEKILTVKQRSGYDLDKFMAGQGCVSTSHH
ncbi:hypothetical protein F8M41_021560 [Gigaspora margarita]|uniref:Uncharacterized protein n=1 Tax=Gigaspora margarita TaxID=4874 RepID=A0A8H4AGK3_GIGMA|nr:hypothetical protein F8M41_021560 [Gigaspora margarita]